MAVDLARYVVALEAQSAQYIAELQKANNKLDEFHGVQTRIVGDIKNMFVGLASIAGARMFARFIESSIEAADQMVKMAQKTGVGIETLQGLKLAAELAGVDVGQLQQGLMRLSRSMSEAAQNADSKAGKAFKDLGVEVKNADGTLRSSDSALRAIADRFHALADGASKAAIAQVIFGRGGGQLIPMLNAGSKNMDDMIEKLRSLGALWSMDAALAAEHFNDNLKVMHVAAQGISSTIAQAMLPAMNQITDAMISFAQEGGTATTVGRALGEVLKVIAAGAIVTGYSLLDFTERAAASAAALHALGGQGWFDLRGPAERLKEARGIIAEYHADQAGSQKGMDAALAALYGAPGGTAAGNTLRAGAQALGETSDETTKKTKSVVDAFLLEAASIGKTKLQIEALKIEMSGLSDEEKDLAIGALNLRNAEQELYDTRARGIADSMRGAYDAMWGHYLDDQQQAADAQSRISAESDAEIQKTIEWVQELRDQYEAYWREVMAYHGDEKGAYGPAGSVGNPNAKLKGQWDQFNNAVGRGLHDSLVDAFAGIEVSWSDLLRKMAAELAVSGLMQMAANAASGSGSGTWWGAILGAFSGGMKPNSSGNIAPGRAQGGPVTGGTMYRVHAGEAFFTPDMSGVVGRAGGRGGTFVEQHIHFDVGLESVDDRIRLAAGPISAATINAIKKAQMRPSIA